MTNNHKITIIGAGLAGSECALQLANFGFKVNLIEMKPKKKTAAHSTETFAELVCSNSLKAKDPLSASGLLKHELKMLNSLLINAAEQSAVAAGGALAVDRTQFSQIIHNRILSNPLITVECREITELMKPQKNEFVVIATGPLTSDSLAASLSKKLGTKNLSFFDASAPIVSAESIDMSRGYFLGRYGKDEDYLNLPLTEEEYNKFYDALISAECVTLKDFEHGDVFEGCMPIEVLAKRDKKALLFGPLKPVGLKHPVTNIRPHAVVQLRKENTAGSSFGLVGFQTNLKWGEQKKVFSLIPGLVNAEFEKFGVMHRNTFIKAPDVIELNYALKKELFSNSENVYIIGQLSGVEGYVESISGGVVAAIDIASRLLGKPRPKLSNETMIGALANYLTIKTSSFQPMNANYGIMPEISSIMPHIIGKKLDKLSKKQLRLEKSTQEINNLVGGLKQ